MTYKYLIQQTNIIRVFPEMMKDSIKQKMAINSCCCLHHFYFLVAYHAVKSKLNALEFNMKLKELPI